MPWTRRQFVASVGALVAREAVAAQRDDGSGTPRVTALDTFAIAPTGDGPRLVGELLIQTAPGAPVEIGEVRLTRAGSGAVVRRLAGADLQARLGELRTGAALATASIPANAAAVVFLWEAIDAGEVIAAVEVDVVATEMATVRRRSTLGVPVTATAAAVRLGRPLAGGDPWVALYDPAMPRGHRRASFEIDGRLVVPARFAIDFVRLDDGGSPGPADDFGRWSGFGHDVLAVAGGTVAAARDAFPDVLTRTRPATWTDDDVAGNYVILEVAPRTFACYEHLQRGSVRVKAGDAGASRRRHRPARPLGGELERPASALPRRRCGVAAGGAGTALHALAVPGRGPLPRRGVGARRPSVAGARRRREPDRRRLAAGRQLGRAVWSGRLTPPQRYDVEHRGGLVTMGRWTGRAVVMIVLGLWSVSAPAAAPTGRRRAW